MEAMLVAAGSAKTDEAVEVWPENWAAWTLYMRVVTQWRYGFNGPTGLDYSVVYPLINHMKLGRTDWDWMLADLQVIEVAAREQIRGNDT